MKKLIYLFIILIIGGVSFLSSCSKGEDDNINLKPNINFVGGEDFISSDVTLNVGQQFKAGINASENSNSNKKLENFKITRTFKNVPQTVLDSSINESNFSINIIATSNPQVGDERWVFSVTDKDGQENDVSFTITTQPSSGPINTYKEKILGSYNSTTGSSFASIDGTVYTLADAKTNAQKIDFLYYYGANDKATIAAPNDDHAKNVYNDETNGLQTWSVLNPTKFKKVTNTINWDAITNDEVIVNETASGVTNTRKDLLSADDILAFITASGKKGLIKVESIETGDDGTITISVKVQQ